MATRKIDAPVQNPSQTSVPLQNPVPLTQSYDSNGFPQQNAPVRIPAPSKPDTNAGAGIALLIPGCLLFLGGLAFAANSKTAGNFDAFYQQVVIGNVMISLGIVILYHSAETFWKVVSAFWKNRG
jgi:hypothetical protein